MEILAEVSDRVMISDNRDLLRVYDRRLKTNSFRDRELLMESGVVPMRCNDVLRINVKN